MSLVLRAIEVEVRNDTRWKWLLVDAAGNTLAYQQVALVNGDADFAAFVDLGRYLRWKADPDRRTDSEVELVRRVGAWAGVQVLGVQIGQVLVDRSPVAVRVEVPTDARFLLTYPLELAHAAGAPLARQGVTVVWEVEGERGAQAKQAVGDDRLRVLSLFSVPTGLSVLALRRERYELARLVRRVVARSGLAVQLEVLQYGVTRERLKTVAQQGWDLLHISGHGLANGLVLEKLDGSADLVSTKDLVRLLHPTRHSLKLAVLSACNSGAIVTAETLRSLGLVAQAEAMDRQTRLDTTSDNGGAVGLAHGLVRELGVAVLGMRYEVDDEFAIALAGELYPRLLEQGQAVDVAVGQAVAEAAGEVPSPAVPALSIATPVLFGPAIGLRLVPPRGRVNLDPRRQIGAGLREEPARFVGRAQAMVAANAALASGSGRAAVVFHGMAGAGKTWCAAELAHQNRGWFKALAWWSAPERTEDAPGALQNLAESLERQLGDFGFTMAYSIGDRKEFERFLLGLTAMLRENGLLLVLDNLETLQSGDGTWRDPRWNLLIEALIGHGGESRTVLTTRVRPPTLARAQRVLIEAVHALTLSESVVLARELPNLRVLLHADPGSASADPDTVRADRQLVRRTLEVVQGHPKLLEFANAAAIDPAALTAQLETAGRTARAHGAMLTTFFQQGASELDIGQFLAVLAEWTNGALARLPDPARSLAQLLACMEDDDRTSTVIELAWPGFWGHMHGGIVPSFSDVVRPLVTAAVVDVEPRAPTENGVPRRYRLHPEVAETIRDATEDTVRQLVDQFLAGILWEVCKAARLAEERGLPASNEAVRAAFSAAPYLIRLQEWTALGFLMDTAIRRDHSPQTMRRAITLLEHIPDDGSKNFLESKGTRAIALAHFDRAQAVQELRVVHREALHRGEDEIATTAEKELAALLPSNESHNGEDKENSGETTDKSSLERLVVEVERLAQLNSVGEHRGVLDRATGLLSRLDRLPSDVRWRRNQPLWELRELILLNERQAGIAVQDWERALTAHKLLGDSMLNRGADEHTLATRALDGVELLIVIDEFDRAEGILRGCQLTLEEHDDPVGLRRVFAIRARVEHQRGRASEAIVLQQTALRYAYTKRDFVQVAKCHNTLGHYLACISGKISEAFAHHLAAALLVTSPPIETIRELGLLLRANEKLSFPVSFEELADVIEQVHGVRFRQSMHHLAPAPANRQAILDELVATVRGLTNAELVPPDLLAHWASGIDAVVAAANGDPEAKARVDRDLKRFARTTWRTRLIHVLHCIAGGRSDHSLLDGLDPHDSTIVQAIFGHLATHRPG
jgi:hypothetical protein